MKKYDASQLYLVYLYQFIEEEYKEENIITIERRFVDYTIVKYVPRLYGPAYIDVFNNREYSCDGDQNGGVYILTKSIHNLSKMTSQEKWTVKQLEELLNDFKRWLDPEDEAQSEIRKTIGKAIQKLTIELGEERTYMLLDKIIQELGEERTTEIISPISRYLGYNVVTKAKNIVRTRKEEIV